MRYTQKLGLLKQLPEKIQPFYERAKQIIKCSACSKFTVSYFIHIYTIFYQENLWKSLILISQIFLIIRCKKSSEIQHCIFTTFVHQKTNFLLPNHEFDKSPNIKRLRDFKPQKQRNETSIFIVYTTAVPESYFFQIFVFWRFLIIFYFFWKLREET